MNDLALLDSVLAEQRAFYETGATRPYAFRAEQLRRLKRAIQAWESQIGAALAADMGKPEFEAFTSEIAFLYWEIDHALKHLKGWMKPRRVGTPMAIMPSRSFILPEPLGQVLIIGPWNYPLMLVLVPLVGAIAAGNTAVLKPSEVAPHTSALMARLIESTFPRSYVAVVEGGADAAQALLARRWDHIFFTGGSAVGKIVARAAAEHLTPVTLELGGKSPCMVDSEVNLAVAARRIAWGKFFNAGQTCVAPDYLLVHRSVKEPFLAALAGQIQEFYGREPKRSPDYARIVSDRHFDRLAALLGEGQVIIGGQLDRASRYIAPTVIDGVQLHHRSMQEEIFGPILPVLTYDHLDQAIATVRKMPNPLALYLFTNNRATEERVLAEVPFGGGCVNNTVVHLSNPNLPFGGRGQSGYGACHGKSGFDTFSHRKPVVKTALFPDIPLRYAPYAGKVSLLKRLLPFI